MSRKRILLVEDEPLICLDMEATLAQVGHDVVVATTVSDALVRVEPGRLDVAVLDYNLQDEDTTAVAVRLRQVGIPLIVCSGSAGLEELGSAFAGARFLSKPFSSDGLLGAVADLAPASDEQSAT